MQSGIWQLSVKFVTHTIDGQDVNMLTYDINTEIENKEQFSCLTITPFSIEDLYVIDLAIKSFYYPENPLLGKAILVSKKGAIHLRSETEIHDDLPHIKEFGNKGILFCGYQMMGTLPFDLVVCQHDYDKIDRERKSIIIT